MGDDWRVCILSGDLPGRLTADEVYARYPASAKEAAEEESFRQALISALGSRLGDQVAVTSNGTEFFLYAPAAGSADEAAQVAREVLARYDVSALVRTERWSPGEEEWLDVTDKPSVDVAAEQQAEHEYRQEQERERSRRAGFPAWQVRVEVPSHRHVVALAGILPPRDGGSAGAAGTSSSGRTAKTTPRASSGSSPVTAALMRIRPSGSGGSAIATCCLTPTPRRSPAAADR
jgi:hypothetical protein